MSASSWMTGTVPPPTIDPTTGKPYSASDPASAWMTGNIPPAAPPPATTPAAIPPAAPPPAAPLPVGGGIAPAPAAGGAASPSAGLLATPGAYEQWIQSHIGQLDNPTRDETMFDSGASSALNNSPLNGVQNFSGGSYAAWLAAQGGAPTANNSAGVLGQLSTGPSSGPSSGNSAGVLSGLTTGPTSGPNTGASAGVLSSLPTGATNAQGAATAAAAGLSTPGAAESFNALYGGGSGDLMNLSDTEQLYNEGIGQLDPYYNYAEQRALQSAQTASAARGGFNSGLAAQQESDITGNLRGQQAQEQASLAPQADAARIAREGLANTEANDAQSQADNRFSTLSSTASAADAANLGQNQLRVTSANNTDQNANSAFQSYWNALNNADTNRVSAGANADTSANNAFQDYWNATNNAGSNLISAGQNADQSAIGAFNAGSAAQNTSEQDALNAWTANAGLAQTQDAANRANIDAQFNIAQGADTSQLGRLAAQGALAKDEQQTAQDRITGGLSAVSGEATQEATLTQQILSDTASIDKMDDTQLQALAQKYGVSVDEIKSIAGDATAAAGLAGQLLTKGAVGGGAPPASSTATLGTNGVPIVD